MARWTADVINTAKHYQLSLWLTRLESDGAEQGSRREEGRSESESQVRARGTVTIGRVLRGRRTKDLSAVSTCNYSKRVRRGRNKNSNERVLLVLYDRVVC